MRITEAELTALQARHPRRTPQKEVIPIVRNNEELLEDAIQGEIFSWIDNADNQLLIPELALIYSIPNAGKRSRIHGGLMKATGLKSGVPDLCCPLPRGGYNGLYVELKTFKAFRAKNHSLSENQQIWIERLRKFGFKVEVQWNVPETINIIRSYLK
jgi:hypothetical protein